MKKVEPKCKNCLCYGAKEGICKVAILIEGQELHMPVFPEDDCHLDKLGIQVEQVRWFVDEDKKVKMEYPEGFFGEKPKV